MSIPLTLIVTLVIVFFTVAFSLQNNRAVLIRLFGWTFEGSLVLVLLTTLCLGIIIQILVSLPAQIRNTQRLAHLTKRVTELEHAAASPAPPDDNPPAHP